MTTEDIKMQMDANRRISGSLDLRGTAITALPEGLTVKVGIYR